MAADESDESLQRVKFPRSIRELLLETFHPSNRQRFVEENQAYHEFKDPELGRVTATYYYLLNGKRVYLDDLSPHTPRDLLSGDNKALQAGRDALGTLIHLIRRGPNKEQHIKKSLRTAPHAFVEVARDDDAYGPAYGPSLAKRLKHGDRLARRVRETLATGKKQIAAYAGRLILDITLQGRGAVVGPGLDALRQVSLKGLLKRRRIENKAWRVHKKERAESRARTIAALRRIIVQQTIQTS